MAFQVTLTLRNGDRIRGADIYSGPTPNVGDTIRVVVGDGTANAQVTGIRKHRARSPGAAGEIIDDADAQECE
jgi:diacylglycerol kinase family enzyme